MEIDKKKIEQFALILIIPFIIDFIGKSPLFSNTKKIIETPTKQVVEKTDQQNENNNKFSIRIVIKNIKKGSGILKIGIFNRFGNFPFDYKNAKYYISEAINNNNDFIYTFYNIPKGTYAISALLDENNNDKLDTIGIFGTPREQYGLSLNPDMTFKIFSFYKSDFTLKNDLSLTIKLK